mmetsp:Transcript_34918/g.84462  ORF Transcript_34918/g.84462 Transcript_34918/m.84462 type:complete len:110 (-) Transcript_34918:2521-2850(-)
MRLKNSEKKNEAIERSQMQAARASAMRSAPSLDLQLLRCCASGASRHASDPKNHFGCEPPCCARPGTSQSQFACDVVATVTVESHNENCGRLESGSQTRVPAHVVVHRA